MASLSTVSVDVGRRFESSEGFPHACDSESDGQVVAMIERFLSAVVQWASAQPDIVAVALVGSHARGTAKPTSDVDLVILTSCPQRYLQATVNQRGQTFIVGVL